MIEEKDKGLSYPSLGDFLRDKEKISRVNQTGSVWRLDQGPQWLVPDGASQMDPEGVAGVFCHVTHLPVVSGT